jgi:hypothetical protein
MSSLLMAVDLPEPLHFLGWGWWIVHVVGIAVVFSLGMWLGKRGKASGPSTPG